MRRLGNAASLGHRSIGHTAARGSKFLSIDEGCPESCRIASSFRFVISARRCSSLLESWPRGGLDRGDRAEFDRVLFDRCIAVESERRSAVGSVEFVGRPFERQATYGRLSDKPRRSCAERFHPAARRNTAGGTRPASGDQTQRRSRITRYLSSARTATAAERVWRSYRRLARIETFVPGLPASVAFLGGPHGNVPLEPCFQRLQMGDQLRILGGSLPLPAPLRTSRIDIGTASRRLPPSWIGYLGVDLILGNDSSGAGDCVVEINPRLTTSYVGLRAATQSNLALAMLEVAEGRRPDLSFRRGNPRI